MKLPCRGIALVLLLLCADRAIAAICNPLIENCPLNARGRSKPTAPSRSSGISLNPSAVPVEKGYGGEVLVYDGSFDFSLVTGTGRVGAALSPSNNEETFFGPPGFEADDVYLQRLSKKEKFKSEKITLATAFTLMSNKKSGLKRGEVALGVLGRYHKQAKTVKPGGGLTAVVGPFTLGYAYAQDSYTFRDVIDPGQLIVTDYDTETASAGISLGNVALDWSRLRIKTRNETPMTINLVTGSVFVKKFILTASRRIETSTRLIYDFETNTLIAEPNKTDVFGGVQFEAFRNVLIGTFYNYYLLKEVSFGLTVFF